MEWVECGGGGVECGMGGVYSAVWNWVEWVGCSLVELRWSGVDGCEVEWVKWGGVAHVCNCCKAMRGEVRRGEMGRGVDGYNGKTIG